MVDRARWPRATERLELRPLDDADLDALHELWTTRGVRRFLWDDRVIPLERTREMIAESRSLFDRHGFGLWGVRLRGSEELIGFAGYWYFRRAHRPELSFGVAADHRGRGYATEAARCLVRYGFDVLGFDEIAASTDGPNAASRRVLDKLGMHLERRATVDALDTCFYRLTAQEDRP